MITRTLIDLSKKNQHDLLIDYIEKNKPKFNELSILDISLISIAYFNLQNYKMSLEYAKDVLKNINQFEVDKVSLNTIFILLISIHRIKHNTVKEYYYILVFLKTGIDDSYFKDKRINILEDEIFGKLFKNIYFMSGVLLLLSLAIPQIIRSPLYLIYIAFAFSLALFNYFYPDKLFKATREIFSFFIKKPEFKIL